MSLLLDALNKADKERNRNQNSPGIDSRHLQAAPQGSSLRWLIIGIVFMTAIVASVTSYLLLSANHGVEKISSNLSDKSTVASHSLATLSQQNTTFDSQPLKQAESNENSPGATIDQNETAKKIDTTQKIAELYHQSSPHNSQSVPQSTSTVQVESISKNQNSTSNLESIATSPGSISSINQFANIPELHDLPDTVLTRISSMKYTEHHFNKLTQSEQGGSVMINGSIKHLNEQLVNGVYLDKILEDGIVLHFENYTFKMHALNSWVNM